MSFMKAIQVSSPGGKFELIQKEIPEPGVNEVLIKCMLAGYAMAMPYQKKALSGNKIPYNSRP